MKFAFIAKHCHIWPVAWLCEVLEVSRSGFHAWLSRPASAHQLYDERLLEQITQSFRRSDRTYGARRVWHDLLAEGFACGLHRVERLMRMNGLRARPRRRGLPKDDGERSVIADIEPVNATGSSEPARARPRLPGGSAQPEVAGRLHLHLDRRRLALHGRRAGSLFAPDRRLVHEGGTRRPVGHGRADDGGLAKRERPMPCCIIQTRAANTPASSSSASWPTTASPAR